MKIAAVAAVIMAVPLMAMGADFNGDGTNDIGIYNSASGLWAVRDVTWVYFGSSADPVPGDYNGDGAVDIAVYRDGSGLWAARGVTRVYFGAGSVPLPGIPSGGGVGFWSKFGSNIYYDGGNVGIGTGGVPERALHIAGDNPRILVEANTMNPEVNFRTQSAANDWAIYMDGATGDLNFYNWGNWVTMKYDTGYVGIGDETPEYRLEVNDNRSFIPVAEFVNTNTGTNALGISVWLKTAATAGNGNNFISFWQGAGGISSGAIEGDGGGGVTYKTSGSDFAEYLPRLRKEEEIEAGDIVGIYAGRIAKTTAGAEQVQVVSTAPAFLGNAPGEKNADLYEKVAFMGQVPVKVRGPVRAGDFIIASGRNDGAGVGVSPKELTAEHFGRIVGRTWEASDGKGVALVNTVVGLKAASQAIYELSLEKDRKIEELSARLERLEKRLKD